MLSVPKRLNRRWIGGDSAAGIHITQRLVSIDRYRPRVLSLGKYERKYGSGQLGFREYVGSCGRSMPDLRPRQSPGTRGSSR